MGSFSAVGASSCSLCAGGTYASESGTSDGCNACPIGKFSEWGTSPWPVGCESCARHFTTPGVGECEATSLPLDLGKR